MLELVALSVVSELKIPGLRLSHAGAQLGEEREVNS